MDNSILADNELITVLNRLADVIGEPNSPWMTLEQARKYVHLSYETFRKLADKGVFKAHSGMKYGISIERYNRDELDLAMKGL